MDFNQLGIGAGIPSFGSPTLENLQFEATEKPGVLQLKSIGRQFVKFYHKKFYNAFQTSQTGQPVWEEKLMVKIVTPGDKTEYDGLAHDYHKRAYFVQYTRFREGKGEPEGTPIEHAEFLLGPESVDLKYLGVHTIEQMAEASDVLCEQVTRGYELREHARVWCKITHGQSLLDSTKKMSAELSAARDQIVRLEAENTKRDVEMAELKKMLNELGPIKRGPGRPRKEDEMNTVEVIK